MLKLEQKKLLFNKFYQTFKKLVLVLVISILVTEISKKDNIIKKKYYISIIFSTSKKHYKNQNLN